MSILTCFPLLATQAASRKHIHTITYSVASIIHHIGRPKKNLDVTSPRTPTAPTKRRTAARAAKRSRVPSKILVILSGFLILTATQAATVGGFPPTVAAYESVTTNQKTNFRPFPSIWVAPPGSPPLYFPTSPRKNDPRTPRHLPGR